jgi:hypothetical protein
MLTYAVTSPLLEQTILLAVVNWSWHAFLDPEDPANEFVASLTILEGRINVLEEDYHVVHHQYPGAHWTTHPELYAKHKNEYVGAAKKQGSVFRHTHVFEIFFLIILRDYKKLAEKFVDMRSPEGQKIAGVSGGAGVAGWGGGVTLTHTEKEQLLKVNKKYGRYRNILSRSFSSLGSNANFLLVVGFFFSFFYFSPKARLRKCWWGRRAGNAQCNKNVIL